MLDSNTIVKVTNRDNGSIGYVIPDLNNLHRRFSAGETKDITFEELKKLSYLPGGMTILRDYLVIDNKDAVAELLGEVEPEYYYSEADIKKLLLTGSLDALMDCLDYAPRGTIDLVKKLAVDLKLNDVAKRKAILDMTGFNVNTAIMVEEETQEVPEQKSGIRRVNEQNKENTTQVKSGRRTAIPVVSDDKYKVIK